MAHALALKELKKAGIFSIEVCSAGVAAVPGQPAARYGIEVLKEMDIDLRDHRSAILDRKMIEEADIILTMTNEHQQAVLQIHPQAVGKVYTLGNYSRAGGDIIDPFGGGIETYRRSADQIRTMVNLLVDRLLRDMKIKEEHGSQ